MFRVGQRVKAISDDDGNNYIVGVRGKIVEILDDGVSILVFFDKDVNGHDGGTDENYGRYWWCSPECLRKGRGVSKKKLVLQKAKQLWNDSNFVQLHPHLRY